MLRLVPYYGNSLNRTYSDMNDMIDSFFKAPFDNGVYDSFKVDVEKEENQYIVRCDLPGVKKENIILEVEDGVLTVGVKFEETREEEDKEKNYLHRERKMINSSRRITLGDIDEAQIEANLEDGVLSVILPVKPEVSNRKSIEIK